MCKLIQHQVASTTTALPSGITIANISTKMNNSIPGSLFLERHFLAWRKPGTWSNVWGGCVKRPQFVCKLIQHRVPNRACLAQHHHCPAESPLSILAPVENIYQIQIQEEKEEKEEEEGHIGVHGDLGADVPSGSAWVLHPTLPTDAAPTLETLCSLTIHNVYYTLHTPSAVFLQ